MTKVKVYFCPNCCKYTKHEFMCARDSVSERIVLGTLTLDMNKLLIHYWYKCTECGLFTLR